MKYLVLFPAAAFTEGDDTCFNIVDVMTGISIWRNDLTWLKAKLETSGHKAGEFIL